MCLVSEEKDPFIAEEDITCYKILIPKDGFYITPYREFAMLTNIEIEDPNTEDIDYMFGVTIVESGYFHCCLNQHGINRIIGNLKKQAPKGTIVKVLKAIIPKGTRYYIGQYGDICAKKIIIYGD